MKKVLIGVVAALSLAATLPMTANASASAEGRIAAGNVKVTVNYTGKGKVDASHKIWVWLFDTPNIGPGSQPVDQVALDANGAVADFANVQPGQVWIAVAFDEQGVMTGNEPPPSGSPIGIFSASNGAPTPVTPGEKAAVTLSFDDTMRMP